VQLLTGFFDDGQTYYWRVRAWNALGESAVTPAWSFLNDVICSSGSTGTGNGLLTAQTHIDTCVVDVSSGSGYFLRDISRRSTYNPHSHNGLMASLASIGTKIQGGGMIQDSDNVWNAGGHQPAGVDAHVYTATVYDYLRLYLGLNSYTNTGSSMESIVAVTQYPSGKPCSDNAFWDPDTKKMYVCVGIGQLPYSGALDVIAHEWGHAVTQNVGANLLYEFDSGALNEAFSDWMGAAVEWANGEPNWTIGEGVKVVPDRNLSNPLLSDPPQPDTYGGSCTTNCPPNWYKTSGCIASLSNDWCGVHTNSGVGNKMFYLLSAEGTHTHNGVTVTGIGIQKAMQIAYYANDVKWEPTVTFSKARAAMIIAAEKLYGVGSTEAKQVANGWSAVKVY